MSRLAGLFRGLLSILSIVVMTYGNSYAQNTFRAVQSNRWDRAITWDCGGCGEAYPGANATPDIVYTEGHKIDFQGGFKTVTVSDLYISTTLIDANDVYSIARGSSPPVVTVTGQLRGYDWDTQAPAVPTSSVIDRVAFIFTGANLLLPTDPVILSWSALSPLPGATFQPAPASTLNVTTFAIAANTALTVASGGVNVLAGSTISGNVNATLTVAAGSTLSIEGNVNGGTALTSFPTVTINGTLTLGANGYLNAINFTLGAGAVLNNGFLGANQLEGWWNQITRPASMILDASSTLNLTASGSQNIFPSTVAYGNVVISPTTTATITLSGGGTYLDVASNFTNNGVFNVNGLELFTGGDLFNVGSINSANSSIYAFSDFSNTGTLDLTTGYLEVTGTMTNDGVLTLQDAYILLFGDLVNNNALVTTGGSTFEFSGGVVQNIGGSESIVFDDMLIFGGSTVSVESNHMLAGVLELGGASFFDGDGSLDASIFTLLSTGDDPTIDAAIGPVPANAAITGKVRVQRYMNPTEGPEYGGEVYRLISSAVQDATAADIQNEIPITGTFPGASDPEGCNGGCGPSMGSYNEAMPGLLDVGDEAFPVASLAETLVPGKGYFMYQWGNFFGAIPDTWDVNGIPNQGNIDFNISYTPDSGPEHDGWNLIGNPYPSAINWDSPTGWSRSGMTDFIYMVDYVTDTYTTYMLNGPGTNGGTPYIPTAQGFWVQGIDDTASLTINENAKAAGQPTTFFRTKEETLKPLLRMALERDGRKDESIILFRDDASHAFDARLDALKMMNKAVNLSTLSDERKLVINSLSKDLICGTNVSLALTEVVPGSYTLTFSEFDSFDENIRIELKDNFTGTTIKVREQDAYSFSVTGDAASYGSARFTVQFSAAEVAIVPGEDGTLRSTIAEGNQWYLNGQPIEGATGQVYEPTETGLYKVRVGSGSCISEDELVYAVTSLDEIGTTGYYVFPNPVGNEVLTVQVPLTDDSNEALLYNSSGSATGVVTFSVKEEYKEGVVDMSSFSSGLYLLRYKSNTGMRVFKISKH